jgi:hypothetical protein
MDTSAERTAFRFLTIYSEILHSLSGSWAGSQDLQVKLEIRVHVWDITCAYLLGILGHKLLVTHLPFSHLPIVTPFPTKTADTSSRY